MKDYVPIFEEAGLAYCRSLGDKGTYCRDNPLGIPIPGANVYNAGGLIWTGSLDLSTADASRLVAVARRLEETLYIHREGASILYPELDPTRTPEAVVTADGIEITTFGLAYVPAAMRRGEVRITREVRWDGMQE